MATEFEQYKFPVKYTEEQYLKAMVGLLPTGTIWGIDEFGFAEIWQNATTAPTEYQATTSALFEVQATTAAGYDSGSLLARLLSCFSSELQRIEVAAWDILNNTDPGVCVGAWLESWERVLGLPGSCSDGTETVTDRQRAAHALLFGEYQITTLEFYATFCATFGFSVTVEEIPDGFDPAVCGVSICGVDVCDGAGEGYSVLRITIDSGSGNQSLMQCAVNKVKQAHVIIDWVI